MIDEFICLSFFYILAIAHLGAPAVVITTTPDTIKIHTVSEC